MRAARSAFEVTKRLHDERTAEVRRLEAEEKLGLMAIARRLRIGRASVYRGSAERMEAEA